MSRVPAVLALLAVLGAGAPARANGRLPASIDVKLVPDNGNNQFILFAGTFGLMLSSDDGATWRWVCENAIGYTGTFDPDYALQSDGTIWATTFDGLRVSRDGGCSFTTIQGALAGLWVGEVEVGPDGRVWAATSSGEDTVVNDAYVSTNGVDFTGTGLNHASAWWRSLKIAPTDGDRIYVSGYVPPLPLGDGMTDPEAILYRSENGGTTWQEIPINGITFGDIPSLMVSAVSPSNPDVVYARAVTANAGIGDVLYRSTNKGDSWSQILAANDVISAVLVLADGRVVAGTINDGVYMSTNGGDNWSHTDQPIMACIGQRSDGVFFSCGSNYEPDLFALGRSTDLMNWSSVMRFSDLAGPLSCPPGTIQFDVCESQQWPTICERLGICGAAADAGPADAGTGPPPKSCCGAGGAGQAVLALLLLPFLWPRRRRTA